MAIVGSFTKDTNGYTGTVRTLSINAKARLVPAEGRPGRERPAVIRARGHGRPAAARPEVSPGRLTLF